MFIPRLNCVHITTGINLEKTSIQQLLEVLIQRLHLPLLVLKPCYLVLHLIDASHLLRDLFLSLNIQSLVLFYCLFTTPSSGTSLHQVMTISFNNFKHGKKEDDSLNEMVVELMDLPLTALL